jgi:hypothetical protein
VSRGHGYGADFEAQVRLTLGEHAGEAPRVDLADGALSKARGIRRRRAVLSTTTALLAVGIAVPLGGQLLSDSGPHDRIASNPTTSSTVAVPEPVQISLSGLKIGDAPSVPYIDGNTFVAADGGQHPVEPAKGSFVTDAVAIGGGELVFEQDQTTAKITYTASGGASDLPKAKSVTPPAIDSSNGSAVFALHDTDTSGRPSQTDAIVSAGALSGGTDGAIDTGMHVRQVMGAYRGRVVFNATDTNKDEVVGVAALSGSYGVTTPYSSLKTVTAVSPDESLLAGILSHGWPSGQRHCAVMVDGSGEDQLWTSCMWNPVEFSPDGSRVLALDARTEGFGPNHIAVLDAQTGAVVAEYTTSGAFGRATFDGSTDSIVMVVVDGLKVALVRCPSDGTDCELASPPASVKAPDDPDSFTQPYQLTAN